MTALRGQEFELQDFSRHLAEAAGIRPGEKVVDVGCGTGVTTVDAARRAGPGPVIGLDCLEASITTARGRIPLDLTNLSFVVADAETDRPKTAPVDAVISRFGLMFFHKPVRAFANIASWIRPGGRLAALVWQTQALNPWILEINQALTDDPAGPFTEARSPFSLGRRELLSETLAQAGFVDISMTTVREPVHMGATHSDAMDFILGLSSYRDLLASLTPRVAEQRRRALAHTFTNHMQADGRVSLPATAWLIRARTPGGP